MEAERRQVTVLFTDMVGFTTFSERSGEEAAFTLMQSLAKPMEDAVRAQGGTVQGFTGDGIMAVFGAPVAHEDAPLRACRAALAILEWLNVGGGDLEARHGIRPQLRIGVNTGPAVVGQVHGGPDGGATVMGDTVNLASRLQALAEPGSAVLSEATYRLVEGMVEASFFLASITSKANPSRKKPIGSTRSARERRASAPNSTTASQPLSGATQSWKSWSADSTRSAPASRSSTSSASPASANRGSCTNSSGRSSRSARGSWWGAARPTASRRPSRLSSR